MTGPQPPGGYEQQPYQPEQGIAPVIPIGPQVPPGQWHINPVTSQPEPGPAPVEPPPWPPDPRPRPTWERDPDRDVLPVSGLLSDLAPDHPARWLLVPGKEGIDLSLTGVLMPVDDMMAAGMIDKMAERQFRHVVSTKTWHYWNGRYHPADTDDFMRRVVQGFARTYGQALRMIKAQAERTANAEAMRAIAAEREKGMTEAKITEAATARHDQVLKKALGFLDPQFKYGKQLLNDPVQERISRQLAKMLGTDGTEYDRDKTLVNFSDGTFELEAAPSAPGWLPGRFREHRQADMLTAALDYPFVPGAWSGILTACPKYHAMMLRLSGGNRELLRYNLEIESLGMIRGNPGEKIYFREGGSNMGKSVCAAVTGTLAGSRWYPAAMELLGALDQRGVYRHASVLNSLEGMTYVTVDETDAGLKLDAGVIKMLASSKKVATTALYVAKQQQHPTDWTIVANSNLGEMPGIRRIDSGVERRIRVVPVPQSDPLGTRLTEHYADVIVAEEGAAIASLLVMMAAFVLEHSMPEPKAVTDATEAYFERCDPRRAWLRERIEPAAGSWIYSRDAYEVFRREAGMAGAWTSQKEFSLFVQSRGYETHKDGYGRMVIINAKWR